jgi:hypothetical protein
MCLIFQIPIRREYRDRFTWLAGQINAAALTPGQTGPAVQFRDIECAVPVTTFTSGYRPGAERRGSPGRSRGREGAAGRCPERRTENGAAGNGAADDGRPDAPGRASAGGAAVPEVAVRLVGALLALAVAAVHVADQGGVTALTHRPGSAGVTG